MSRRAKALLMGIIAVIVVAILIAAYFASQPEVKWWTPEKEIGKEEVKEINNQSIKVVRVNKGKDYVELLNITGGNFSSNTYFKVGTVLYLQYYTFIKGGYDTVTGNFTAWAERVSGDYILQKLVIHYTYGNEREDEYTAIWCLDDSVFEAANLSFNMAKNHDPHEGDLWWDWRTNHRMVGVNKDAKNADFYGVSFSIEILLEDLLSMNLTHTITFTVTAYYGHPTLLGWTDMHELKTQVVLKIVPGGEKE